MSVIRVLLVDDHAIVRAGLRALIEGQSDMNVVGDSGDGAEALALVVSSEPDIVVLDLGMPGGGLPAIEAVRRACSHSRVLVLTMHDDMAYLRAALTAGASGYLVKRAADTDLLAAIRAVHSGRSYIDVALAEGGLQGVVDAIAADNPSTRLQKLSQREREVLELVAHGYTNREVADRLTVSINSVETYRARVLEKLGLKTRAELTRFALDMGLVRPAASVSASETAADLASA